MQNKLIIAVLIAALAITASIVLAAQAPRLGYHRGGGPGMGCDFTKGKIAHELGLTKDQIAKLKEIHANFMDATKDVRDQLKAKHEQLVGLLMVDPPDPAAIKNLFTEMDPLKVQLREIGIDHAVEAYNVLTPAQKAKVHEMIKAHVNRMGKGGGMWGHGF